MKVRDLIEFITADDGAMPPILSVRLPGQTKDYFMYKKNLDFSVDYKTGNIHLPYEIMRVEKDDKTCFLSLNKEVADQLEVQIGVLTKPAKMIDFLEYVSEQKLPPELIVVDETDDVNGSPVLYLYHGARYRKVLIDDNDNGCDVLGCIFKNDGSRIYKNLPTMLDADVQLCKFINEIPKE